MPAVRNDVFRALADPTRRAIFERLARDGEQTVHALTDRAGVSQPMVSKHLTVLKRAKLVRHRRDGRETHYRAQPNALAPMAASDCARRLDYRAPTIIIARVTHPSTPSGRDDPTRRGIS